MRLELDRLSPNVRDEVRLGYEWVAAIRARASVLRSEARAYPSQTDPAGYDALRAAERDEEQHADDCIRAIYRHVGLSAPY